MVNIKEFDEFLKEISNYDTIIEKNISPLLLPGENFSSVLYKLYLKVIKNDKKEENIQTILKIMPPSEEHQNLFNIRWTFKKEISWYTEALPAIQNFESVNGFAQNMDFFPKFFGARLSLDPSKYDSADSDALLIIEDLTQLGYKNVDKQVGFDLKSSKEVLKKLATLHAVPLAMKRTNFDLFKNYVLPAAYDFPVRQGESDTTQVESFYGGYLSVLEKNQELKSELPKIKMNLHLNSWFNKIKREPWSTILHNDCWANNIMLRKIGEEVDIKFIDMQTTAHGSVASDLIVFLFTSVELSVLKTELDNLIKYYFNEFIKILKEYNVDTNEFTLDGLLEEMKIEANQGMFQRVIGYSSIMLYEKDKKQELTELSSENYDFFNDFQKLAKQVTPRHVEKYTYITEKCITRGWI